MAVQHVQLGVEIVDDWGPIGGKGVEMSRVFGELIDAFVGVFWFVQTVRMCQQL